MLDNARIAVGMSLPAPLASMPSCFGAGRGIPAVIPQIM